MPARNAPILVLAPLLAIGASNASAQQAQPAQPVPSLPAPNAAATTAEPPSSAMGAFASTTHSLLDTRLMMAWARALNESGHVDKARYLAARLREFRNPASDDFFAVCNSAPAAGSPRAFQCETPGQPLSWRDFKP